jgi:hypothetical protein
VRPPLRHPSLEELSASVIQAKALVEHVRTTCAGDYSQMVSVLTGAIIIAANEHPDPDVILAISIVAIEHARRIVLAPVAARPAQEPS